MIFRSRRSKTADPERELELAEGRSTEELIEELESLTRMNQERPDADTEVKLVALRHAVGIRRLDEAQKGAAYPEAAFDRLPDRNGDLAGIDPADLSPEVLRAGILRDGCLLIRGAVDRDAALALAEGIDRAFHERDKAQANFKAGRPNPWGRRRKTARMYYSEFTPTPRFRKALSREWIQGGGGLWVADSPHILFEMLDAFERAGLEAAIGGYLGEPALISVQKCTLRKVDPDAGRGWHQDGAFMGDVRALNVWLSLSHCGDEAPGMDVVPRRLDGILTSGEEGADFNWSISEQMAEEAAGETGIVRPIFEPGDVLLFDDLFLHTTAAEPSMPKSRMAIESWFFGASASPEQYSPLAA
jgi:Phytanoyl-CoA dioxygenase (PhyH)